MGRAAQCGDRRSYRPLSNPGGTVILPPELAHHAGHYGQKPARSFDVSTEHLFGSWTSATLKQSQAPLLVFLLCQSPFQLPSDFDWIWGRPVLCYALVQPFANLFLRWLAEPVHDDLLPKTALQRLHYLPRNWLVFDTHQPWAIRPFYLQQKSNKRLIGTLKTVSK